MFHTDDNTSLSPSPTDVRPVCSEWQSPRISFASTTEGTRRCDTPRPVDKEIPKNQVRRLIGLPVFTVTSSRNLLLIWGQPINWK